MLQYIITIYDYLIVHTSILLDQSESRHRLRPPRGISGGRGGVHRPEVGVDAHDGGRVGIAAPAAARAGEGRAQVARVGGPKLS